MVAFLVVCAAAATAAFSKLGAARVSAQPCREDPNNLDVSGGLYGLGCRRHDATTAQCARSQRPSSCDKEWAFVDNALTCLNTSLYYSEAARAFYSYELCGEERDPYVPPCAPAHDSFCRSDARRGAAFRVGMQYGAAHPFTLVAETCELADVREGVSFANCGSPALLVHGEDASDMALAAFGKYVRNGVIEPSSSGRVVVNQSSVAGCARECLARRRCLHFRHSPADGCTLSEDELDGMSYTRTPTPAAASAPAVPASRTSESYDEAKLVMSDAFTQLASYTLPADTHEYTTDAHAEVVALLALGAEHVVPHAMYEHVVWTRTLCRGPRGVCDAWRGPDSLAASTARVRSDCNAVEGARIVYNDTHLYVTVLELQDMGDINGARDAGGKLCSVPGIRGGMHCGLLRAAWRLLAATTDVMSRRARRWDTVLLQGMSVPTAPHLVVGGVGDAAGCVPIYLLLLNKYMHDVHALAPPRVAVRLWSPGGSGDGTFATAYEAAFPDTVSYHHVADWRGLRDDVAYVKRAGGESFTHSVFGTCDGTAACDAARTLRQALGLASMLVSPNAAQYAGITYGLGRPVDHMAFETLDYLIQNVMSLLRVPETPTCFHDTWAPHLLHGPDCGESEGEWSPTMQEAMRSAQWSHVLRWCEAARMRVSPSQWKDGGWADVCCATELRGELVLDTVPPERAEVVDAFRIKRYTTLRTSEYLPFKVGRMGDGRPIFMNENDLASPLARAFVPINVPDEMRGAWYLAAEWVTDRQLQVDDYLTLEFAQPMAVWVIIWWTFMPPQFLTPSVCCNNTHFRMVPVATCPENTCCAWSNDDGVPNWLLNATANAFRPETPRFLVANYTFKTGSWVPGQCEPLPLMFAHFDAGEVKLGAVRGPGATIASGGTFQDYYATPVFIVMPIEQSNRLRASMGTGHPTLGAGVHPLEPWGPWEARGLSGIEP
jgi:hypothetical protein